MQVARTFLRILESLACDADLFFKVKGTPWRPAVRAEGASTVVIDASPVVPESRLLETPAIPSAAASPRRVSIRRDRDL